MTVLAAMFAEGAIGQETQGDSLEAVRKRADGIQRSLNYFNMISDAQLQKAVAPRAFPKLQAEAKTIKDIITAEVARAVMSDKDTQSWEKIYTDVEEMEKKMAAILNGE